MRLDDPGDSVQRLGWSGDGRIVGVAGRRLKGTGLVTRRTALFTVKTDGSGRRILRDKVSWMNQREDIVIDWRLDDPEKIVVNRWKQGVTDSLPVPVRVTTGALGSSIVRKDGVGVWFADPEGRVRVGTAWDELEKKWLYQLYGRVGADDDVEMLYEFELFKENPGIFAGYHPNPELIYVQAETEGGFAAIYEYDMKQRTRGRQVFALEDRDVCGLIYDGERRVLAAEYLDEEGPKLHYLDEDYAKLQRGIDKALPGMRNRVIGWSRDQQTLLIVSDSDVVPPRYYRLKRGAGGGLMPLFSSRPKLEGARLSPMQSVRFETVGGVLIGGVLTRPVGVPKDKPVPAVVIPGDGPGDAWPEFGCAFRLYPGFTPFAQFFASRGYAVLGINMRGTAGRGRSFRVDSEQHWARSALEDIEAGVDYLVSQGIADPKRIGIYGSGFSGYASLLAMAHKPELFAAGGSFGGAGDLDQLRREWKTYWGLKRMLLYSSGFPHADSSIQELSPVRLAAHFKAPVFLGHGDDDSLYRLAQSKEMEDELEDAGVMVELHRYRYEGGHFYDERNRIDYHRKLEAFFERHLKGSPGNQVAEAH